MKWGDTNTDLIQGFQLKAFILGVVMAPSMNLLPVFFLLPFFLVTRYDRLRVISSYFSARELIPDHRGAFHYPEEK